jgi:hypothetical protein
LRPESANIKKIGGAEPVTALLVTSDENAVQILRHDGGWVIGTYGG